MLYRDLIDACLFYAGQARGGSVEHQIKKELNAVYKRILDSGLVPHEHREFSLTTRADQSQYGLPIYVKKVLNIEDPTNNKFVWETTAREYDRSYPGTTTTGTPLKSYSLGIRGVERYPEQDGVVSVRSDSTSDANATHTVQVTGFDVEDKLVTESVEMTALTQKATTNSYSATLGLERITKTPSTGMSFSGNLTVTDSTTEISAVVDTSTTATTTTTFVSDTSGLSSTDDAYNGRLVTFSGDPNDGLTRVITDYTGSTKSFTVDTLGTALINDQDFTIGGFVLAVIPSMWESPDYQWIEFYPGPGSEVTYTIRCEMRKPPLINDGDWPEFDQDFHEMLVFGTTMTLLPTFGKSDTAMMHREAYNDMWQEFTGQSTETTRALFVFANVQNRAGYSGRPHRPLIEGVDYGLASGQ